MTSNVPATLAAFGALAPAAGVLAQSKVDAKAIAEGIGPSFGILTYRGKVWRLKYRGDEHPILLPAEQPGLPQNPAPYVDVVIVNCSPTISKIFYDGPYQEGDSDAPDCFSTNGVSPDPSSPKKQAEFCATCPKNIWGSRANTVTGAKGKACQDSKRLAVVPLNDLKNDQFGGPMLLRIPPASLQGMGTYNAHLQNAGHTFYSVATRLQFSSDKAYPEIQFFPIRALGDGEAQTVLELQTDARVTRMLTEAVDQVRDAGVGGLPQAGGQPAVPPTGGNPGPVPAVVPTPAVVQAGPVATPAGTVAAPAMVVVAADHQQATVDPGPMPDFLQRHPAAVVAAAPAPTPAPVAPVAPVAPTPTPAPPPTSPAPVAPPQPAYVMSQGETYTREQYHAAGWTDDQLVANGKMTIVMPQPAPAPAPASAPAPARRGRRPAAPQPSPAPTAEAPPQPVAAPASLAAPAAAPAPTPPVPAAASSPPAPAVPAAGAQDPALAALDAKLAAVL